MQEELFCHCLCCTHSLSPLGQSLAIYGQGAEQQCLDGSHSGRVQILLQALSLRTSPGGNKSCSCHLLLTLDLKELFKAQRNPYGKLCIRFICCSQFFTLHCISALCLKLSDNLVMAAHSFCALPVLQRRFLYTWSLQKWVQYPKSCIRFHIGLKWCLQFPYSMLTINIHCILCSAIMWRKCRFLIYRVECRGLGCALV